MECHGDILLYYPYGFLPGFFMEFRSCGVMKHGL